MTLVNAETGELIEFDQAAAERRAERITLRLDAIADNYNAVLPMIREAIEKRDDLALGYRSPGEYVADRFGQSLAGLGLEVRRAVVGELTSAGMSTRAIAPVVGVSPKTVARDVHAGVSGDTPALSKEDEADLAKEHVQTHGWNEPIDHDRFNRSTSGAPVVSHPIVTGIDGKTYTRPAPVDPAQRAAEAVAEFPDLAYHYDLGQYVDVINMAGDLRRYRDRGELEVRLDNLRRSIAVDRAHRDGTYRPGTTAVMGEDGEYHMQPLPALPEPRTCPTCNGVGTIKE